MTTRPICGHCPDCLEITNRICTPPRSATTRLLGARPTARSLKRHGERFGWEGIPQLANELGISLTLPKDAAMSLKKQKASGIKKPPIKARIREYLADGKGAEYIAEIEKTSASRARRLIKEVQEEDADE